MWYLPGLAPRKHSVACANQTAVSTKGGFQLVLGVPYFLKDDSQQSKVAGRVGGRAGEAGKKASCLASCIERVLHLQRPVNNLRCTSFSSRLAKEGCQSRGPVEVPIAQPPLSWRISTQATLGSPGEPRPGLPQ